MVATSNDTASHPGISSGVMPLVRGEGYEKLNRTTMESHAFGSESLAVEHRSGGDININTQCAKLTGSFDSLIDKLKDRNVNNLDNIVLEPSLAASDMHCEYTGKSTHHGYEKLKKGTMETVDTYGYAQPHAYLTLSDIGISGSTAGSRAISTSGCNVDPPKHLLGVYEKLNKATMEATVAHRDAKPRSMKHPESGYEQLNKATMETKPVSGVSKTKLKTTGQSSCGYEPLNKDTMEPMSPSTAVELQMGKHEHLHWDTIGSEAQHTWKAE